MYEPLLVIHETGVPLEDCLAAMGAPNTLVSYHVVVATDGTVYYCVLASDKAYGAASSSFDGESMDGSVDDFSYHVALESPLITQPHAGYSDAQYRGLAYVIAQTGIPDARITTHGYVDTSNQYGDPSNLDMGRLFRELHKFSRVATIDMGIAI